MEVIKSDKNGGMVEEHAHTHAHAHAHPAAATDQLTAFVRALLSRVPAAMWANTQPKIEPHMREYVTAFTHVSADPFTNYEYYEFVGDGIVNAAAVQYITRRFPLLQQPRAIKILARLKIILISKAFLAQLAAKHEFSRHIRTHILNAAVLEDVFEAFIGCTASLVEQHVGEGSGYAFCYKLMESFLCEEHLPTTYESLFDARTRIKELLDITPDLGRLEFLTRPAPEPGSASGAMGVYCTCVLVAPDRRSRTVLAEAWALSKSEVIQRASEKSLLVLKSMGHERLLTDDFINLMETLKL